MARDCPRAGENNNRGYGNDRQQATKGRVHALTRHQAASTSGTVSGTLRLFGHTVFVLFDTGATHSVTSISFAKHINTLATPLYHALSISTHPKPLFEASLYI